MNLKQNNIIIGIDTSCYTTSIAAISLEKSIILNEKIMLNVKENSNGLRQSEGVFQHINNLGELSEKLNYLHDNYNIVGVCVSKKPRPIENSYMPVFTVGYNFGKFMANSLNCKFYETTHQENHIEASLLNSKINNRDRFLSVHMSGGTTEILLLNRNKNSTEYNIEIVGGTKDISFGQLIDRIGVKLGYRFPAGKYIDKNAISCERKILNGLKTSVKDGYMNLSGLENQINKIIDSEDCKYISKLLLEAVVRNMYKSLIYISKLYNINEVVFCGGVAASEYVRTNLSIKLRREKIYSHFTKSEYSTDNACGCAIIGVDKYEIESFRNK